VLTIAATPIAKGSVKTCPSVEFAMRKRRLILHQMDASHSSVDKATVLDASGSEADNSNEALMVLIAPLYYVRRVDV
jgi:hypothetical protein